MKTITMYLPQFHTTPENDEWWGKGFTEWTAAKAAQSLFDGHAQPKIPLNNNYYNLLEKETLIWQANLMKEYGIDGQCIYHYYFKNGRKILEKPAENLLEWKDVDMPFCFCWANASWVRTWSSIKGNPWADKFEKREDRYAKESILLEQKYGREKEWKEHFEYLLPFFKDDRYIKVNGKPVFLIFEPYTIPCLYQMIELWKELAITSGLPGIYSIGMNSVNAQKGLDAVLLNAPNMFWDIDRIKYRQNVVRPDYQMIWENIIKAAPVNGVKTYVGGVVNFDDSPRRGRNGIVFSNFSVDAFREGMINLYQKNRSMGNEFVFINAWNEWGEGMYLEPDAENGYACLEAVKDAKKASLESGDVRNICIDAEIEQEYIRDLNKKIERHKKIWECFDRWMTLKEEGKKIYNYLSNYGIKTIAVYGMGQLGKHLLAELGESDIIIKYIIDRRAELHHPVYEVKSIEGELQEVDAVIITPIWDFENIYEALKEKMKCQFFSLEELINES